MPHWFQYKNPPEVRGGWYTFKESLDLGKVMNRIRMRNCLVLINWMTESEYEREVIERNDPQNEQEEKIIQDHNDFIAMIFD